MDWRTKLHLKKLRDAGKGLVNDARQSDLGQQVEKVLSDARQSETAGKVRKAVSTTADAARSVAHKARTGVYRGAQHFEEQADQNQGLPKTLKRARMVANGLYKTVRVATKPAWGPAYDRAEPWVSEKWNRLNEYHNSFVDTFSTQGNYDPNKVSHLLAHQACVAETFGVKAVAWLKEQAANTANAVQTDYRRIIPTQQELKTKYAGVGTQYEGILLRPHMDSCLAFHREAHGKLPQTDLGFDVMEDIKPHACESADDLVRLYQAQDAQAKLGCVQRYLKKPENGGGLLGKLGIRR